MLAAGVLAQLASAVTVHGPAFLIPTLHRDRDLTLVHAGLVVAAPTVGVMLTLVAWGAAVDRWGEKVCLVSGLAGTTLAALAASLVHGTLALGVALLVAGAFAASANAASGRIVVGWFPARRRGLAMGIRQTAQPLGVAVAGLVLPLLAWHAGLLVLGVFCLAAAFLVAIFVRDPAAAAANAPGSSANPYRTPELWRIHAASALLVIPQFAVAVFAFDYLVNALGWGLGPAGLLLAVTQLAGAGTRLAAGYWSDRVRSRLGPMRRLALIIGAVMALLAVLAMLGSAASVAALALAAVLTVSPNGLAFTAVAERAGPRWAGRALGVQNTFQNLVATAVAPPLALVIAAAGGGGFGYGLAFGCVMALPFLAAIAIPAGAERS